jgi:uncharacterized membrane protein YraQ (UPF0718 family)/YHS domain-containing protein
MTGVHPTASLLSVGPVDMARSLRAGFLMFWETLWPLVLGFGLSGAVQSFVSRDAMRRSLGDHRPASVARASGYGMVSSSCSYAASAMAKSLVVKGADFLSSMVFMFASTNLVVELGIVLVVLMGWQFAASEFVGGAVMIVLLVLVGGLYLRGRLVVEARARLAAAEAGGEGHDHGAHGHHEAVPGGGGPPLRTRLRSRDGWTDAATYTMADLTMLRKELVFGYVAAGFLATLVPVHVWNVVFLQGHGVWTSLENVVVGPFIALISCVCSVGNVPLAAALWHGGISFGGVVAFLFADLIALPLLLVYRRFYGWRLTLRMLAVFWAVMSAAGLVTEGIFRAAGLVPTDRHGPITPDHLSWNATTWLNIVALLAFAVLYRTYRRRPRGGATRGYAIDPVCGMQVETANAPATTVHDGTRYWFCADRCRARFEAGPGRFVGTTADVGGPAEAVAGPGGLHTPRPTPPGRATGPGGP